MYALIEHTADMGIHVEAPDLNSLFADAACGLFALIAGEIESIRPTQSVDFQVTGSNKEYLLLDWLAELLVSFELQNLLFGQFTVIVDDQGLKATGYGEPVDATRHRLAHEVKAITYHGLRVIQDDGGWTADVIVDI